MFQKHQQEISQYAKTGPDQMARVITFVYLTVQQSIFDIPDLMRDVDKNGIDSKFIWGFKIGAYEWINENKAEVYYALMSIYHGYPDPADAEYELLKTFADMPGLGLVKGGFCNQLIFGFTGCIDSHNITRFGTNPAAFSASRFKRAKHKTRGRMAREYISLCSQLGGPEVLWDGWCAYVADRNNTTAIAVSELHVSAIME